MSRSVYLGLMSGTSMDGVDGVLVDFQGSRIRVGGHVHRPYPGTLRDTLRDLARARDIAFDTMGRANIEVARHFADTALDLLAHTKTTAAAVTAIGSHGQTLRHAPDLSPPYSWQVGDPATIASRTGIPTIGDFRAADIAAGGQGAPLVPPFHAACFAAAAEDRAVVNIGGIANLTILAGSGPCRGFDCGPGNTLLDYWTAVCRQHPFDRDGAFAASGTVCEPLLAALQSDPYFQRPPPKSTGPEHFSPEWLDRALMEFTTLPPADVQATLAELTAGTIADAVNAHAPTTKRLWVCGGGTYNGDLMRRLARRLGDTPVMSTAERGIAPEAVEAAAMAWLARETWHRRPGNEPAVTGARERMVLGAIHYGPSRG